MQKDEKIRLIVDTNIWISSLIGKHLANLQFILDNPKIELVTTPHLIEEIQIVTNRPKLCKYFSADSVHDLLAWMNENMVCIEIGDVPKRCRDPKDDYLLELAVQSHAIYLVSGDSDLLEIKAIEGCRIMTINQLMSIL